MQPFAPNSQATKVLSVSTTSSSVEISGSRDVVIYNAGSTDVFWASGPSGVTATIPSGATAGSMPIPAGAQVAHRISGGGYIAAIVSSGSSTLYITPGSGM